MEKVLLKEEARKFLERRVYTIYSKWIKEEPSLKNGVFVEFLFKGEVIARGFFERIGPIGGRIISYVSENDSKDLNELIVWRLERARKLRERGGEDSKRGYRLLYADSDGTPGLIIDVYGDTSVIQSSSFGWDASSNILAEKIVKLGISERVYLKNDQRGRKAFGLPVERKFLIGKPPSEVVIEEEKYRVIVNFDIGQKTGFYLDQREARKKIASMDLRGMDVLDLFSYTGAFSIAALSAGAKRTLAIDEDERALALAERNLILNGYAESFDVLRGRVEKVLDWIRAKRKKFDFIVADPPAMIPTLSAKEKGMKAYEKLFESTIEALKPGGILYASSCSYSLRGDELLNILRKSSWKRGLELRVLHQITPFNATPYVRVQDRGLLYLKGFLVEIE